MSTLLPRRMKPVEIRKEMNHIIRIQIMSPSHSMKNLPARFFILLLNLVLIPSCPAAELRKDIPDASWEPIFFESINELTTLAGMTPLRDKTLAEGDLELRIWAGFGLSPLKGIVLKRINGNWQAFRINMDYNLETKKEFANYTNIPTQGRMSSLWKELNKLELLTLPDQSQLDMDWIVIENGKTRRFKRIITDGISYVVEVQKAHLYRTYQYGNPGKYEHHQGKSLSQIIMLIDENLETALYSAPNTFPRLFADKQVVLVTNSTAVGAFRVMNQRTAGQGKASVQWMYRADGKTDLSGNNVTKGSADLSGWDTIQFGPFSIKWSSGMPGKGLLYYPDPNGELQGKPERPFAAITDVYSFEGLDAADPKWEYKAAYVDLPTVYLESASNSVSSAGSSPVKE